MKQTDQKNIDALMDDLQQSIFMNKLKAMEDSVEGERCDRKIGCDRSGTTININISPIINTSSAVTEKTKNSPLHELGSILGSFIGLAK